jgi:hypothetical protein
MSVGKSSQIRFAIDAFNAPARRLFTALLIVALGAPLGCAGRRASGARGSAQPPAAAHPTAAEAAPAGAPGAATEPPVTVSGYQPEGFRAELAHWYRASSARSSRGRRPALSSGRVERTRRAVRRVRG